MKPGGPVLAVCRDADPSRASCSGGGGSGPAPPRDGGKAHEATRSREPPEPCSSVGQFPLSPAGIFSTPEMLGISFLNLRTPDRYRGESVTDTGWSREEALGGGDCHIVKEPPTESVSCGRVLDVARGAMWGDLDPGGFSAEQEADGHLGVTPEVSESARVVTFLAYAETQMV